MYGPYDLKDGFISIPAGTYAPAGTSAQGLYFVTPGGEVQRVYGQAAYPTNGCF